MVELPRWQLPIVGYVQWWLLKGRTPEDIRAALEASDTYPPLTTAEWEAIWQLARRNTEASIRARGCDPQTKVCDLWTKDSQ